MLDEDISERCLCGALMHELNRSNKRIKQLPNDDGFVNNILPDIIVHSRGKETPDNLLVLEMKKVVPISKIRKRIEIDLGR